MGKPFKIVLAAILLIVIAIGTLPFFIDPNDFKPEISAAVKDATGRELILEGDLKLSVFPWIGISTGKITLGNAEGFQDQPFATAAKSKIKVKLLPLLSKKIEVKRIVIKGLALNLAKNKQGITNWDDLTKSDDSKLITPPATDSGMQDEQSTPFSIGGISIENAHVNWDNQQTGKHIEIKDLNLNTDQFNFDEPVDVTLSLIVLNDKAKLKESIKLSTEFTVNEKLDTFLLVNTDLHTTTEGESVPGKSIITTLSAKDVALDMAKQTAKISGLQLKSGDVALSAEITGADIKDKPYFQGPVTLAPFSPAKLMQQLAIARPSMQDANALNNMTINFDLQATADSANLQNLVMTLDDTHIKGSASIKNFALPAIAFNLNADAIDADRYLSAPDKSSKPIASPAIALAAGANALPVETLRKLDANGSVSLGKLKIRNLNMQDIHLNLSAKNGIVTTQQSVNQFYQGAYSGNLSMDTRNNKPTLAVTDKLDHVQIEPLLKDFKGEAKLSGMVNATAQLQGQGNKTDELKSSLNGQLSFLVKDSVIKGFNLQKIIDSGKALIKGSALPADSKNDQTLFSEMSGTATVSNGIIQNNDLVANSSKLRVNGKGTINLNSEALDYKVDAKLLKAEATAAEPEQIKAAATINIDGTLSKPTYSIDIESLLTDKNKAKIDKLINKIDKKLGPGVGDLLKGFLNKQK
ncbi:MAG: AsmA family protein [Methylobacter sp.]